MKTFVTAAFFAAALAVPAMADDVAAANERCVSLANEQVALSMPADTPADQKEMITEMVTDMCGCMTSKIAELGDDGAKVLRIMVKQPKEDAMITDEAQQRAKSVALMVAEFGVSEAEAEALYDRVNPQVQQIAMTCQGEAQQKLMNKLQGG